MKSNPGPGLRSLLALLALIIPFLLATCAPALEPEVAPATVTAADPASTVSPQVTLTPTPPPLPSPAPANPSEGVAVTLSQPTYYTTETIFYTVTNRLDDPVYVSEPDCSYGSVQRLEGDVVIPLTAHFFDRTEHFIRTIPPRESLVCRWGQELFQEPDAEGAARFLNADRESARRLPAPPGDYQIRLPYYLSEEEVGQEGRGQPVVSARFSVLRAPLREQLVVKHWKTEYRLGEPIDYTIRNVGEPRDWAGPITLQGSGCGAPLVEASDGSPVLAPAPGALYDNRMGAGRARLCTIDPELWPDPVPDSLPLEPGTYRIGLRYRLDESLDAPGDKPRLVYSAPFTVTDEPLPDVTVTVEKTEYALGEPVGLTLSNNTDAPIYTYDNCSEPPVWWVDGNWINALVMRITEEWIPAGALAAGESANCTWEQSAYRVLPEGDDNFICFDGCTVPAGTYQLRFHYYLSDPEEDLGEDGRRPKGLDTVSRPFVITEP